MMKRVWKPLSVGRLRLYQVDMKFHNHPEWNKTMIVAAKKPLHAKELMENIYKETEWIDEKPVFFGSALNVYMPKAWWDDGIPSE